MKLSKQNKYQIAKDSKRLNIKQKWRSKETKANSISKSKSGDLRRNYTNTIHYHHETLELALIIKSMSLLNFDLLTTWHYIINRKNVEKRQHIKLANEAMLFVSIFLIHNSKTKIFTVKNDIKKYFQRTLITKISKKFKNHLRHFRPFFKYCR